MRENGQEGQKQGLGWRRYIIRFFFPINFPKLDLSHFKLIAVCVIIYPECETLLPELDLH